MKKREYEFIQGQIGYCFDNLDLLQQAFIRRSYSKENGGGDNEVLEFIGDKVLDVAVVHYLADCYGHVEKEGEWKEYFSNLNEGELTDCKRKLVERKMLAHRIDEMDLSQFLILGKGDVKNKVYLQDSVKEDLFEAILGAVAIDCDWNFDVIQDTVEVMLNPDEELENTDDENYVGIIHDWVSKHGGGVPRYHYEEGRFETTFYDGFNGLTNMGRNLLDRSRYNMHYRCCLNIDMNLPNFRDFGLSKAEARKNVCKFAYEYLVKNNLINNIKDEIDNPCKAQAINQLEILARRGYFSIPKYDFFEKYDNDGNPIWECECYIEEYDNYYCAESSSKKDAKKNAAFGMLKFVLENN